MKYGVYAIRDQLVGFNQPALASNDEDAIRNFKVLVNDKKSGSMLSAQPQYFDLYKIAEFDNDDGSIKPLKEIQLLVTGLSLKGEIDDSIPE